jgi:hypothetical protein
MPLGYLSPLLCLQKQHNIFCIEMWYAHVHNFEQNLAKLRDVKNNYNNDDNDDNNNNNYYFYYYMKVIRCFNVLNHQLWEK